MSTTQRRTRRAASTLALRKLMLHHDHPWPRVQQRNGSIATVKTHFTKLAMDSKEAFLKMLLSSANWPPHARRNNADKIVLPAEV